MNSTIPFEAVGHDLARPECVLATAAGDLLVSDWRGGVTVIGKDGGQRRWLARSGGVNLRPNGVALTDDGSLLIAHLGVSGGVYRLQPNGALSAVLLEVDNVPLPPTNFVTIDAAGRTWISVSTRHEPRQRAWRRGIADGFIVSIDSRGARIVADGLAYTNEVRVDPSGRWLYAIETFGRRLSRFPIRPNGDLGDVETVVEFGHGCFPDGFEFDSEAGLWITSLVSNRLLRLHDDRLETILDDGNASHTEAVEQAFLASAMSREDLGPIPGTKMQHLTSIAFGGVDLRTGYLGCLHASCVYRFRSPVAGVAPVHWNVTIP
jgi:sugar lactone lactonase YvrE